MLTRWSLTSGILTLAAVLGFPSSVSANVGSLRSAITTPSDAPPGLSTPHSRVYTRFTRKMRVPTKTTGLPGKGSTDCPVPASFGPDGWIQGLVEGFDSDSILHVLSLCSSAFQTPQGAHTAYASTIADATRYLKKHHLHSTSIAPVGAESFAYGASQGGLVLGEIVFRHDNALVQLYYIGPATYSFVSFVALAQRTNRRLH
jgi:hypothetical protein